MSIYIVRVLVMWCVGGLILQGGSGDPLLMLLDILALVSGQTSLSELVGCGVGQLRLM